jgi:mannose-6-phosphate isomerase-like protein (cupin superfamily)
MDNEQRTAASARLDAEQAAKIVRTIEVVEHQANLAISALSERMMGSAVQAIRKLAVEPWQVVEVDMTARIVAPEWKMARGVGTGDAWLELNEIGPEDHEGFSWISVAVGAGASHHHRRCHR